MTINRSEPLSPNSSTESPQKVAKSPLAIIFITIFIDLLGFGLVLPALPFYAETYGATPLMVGLLTMTYSLMQLLFSPMWGRISDRVGRRPIILIGLAGACGAFLVFGLAKSLLWLFIARTLAGILSSASLPTSQAFIADSTTPENRAKGMGLIGAAFGLGFIFGPALGGLLTKTALGYALPALVASGLAGANFIWAYFRLPESLHHSKRTHSRSYLSPTLLKETFGNHRIAFLLTIHTLHVFAFANMESTLALFGEHQVGMSAFGMGGLLAEVGIITVIIQGLFIGKLTKRFGEVSLTITGVFFMALGLLLNTQVTTIAGFIAVVPFYAFGSALTNPTLGSMISRSSSDTKQGGTMGVAHGLSAAARVLGPICGTWLFQTLSPEAPYYVASSVLAVVWIITLLKLRRTMQPVLTTSAEA
jgi:MFS transporter, DHA1 family, tetracycline resistance protein